MDYTAYFQRGRYKLHLNTAPFALDDFYPPAILEAANIAEGTSANQYGGASLVDKRALSSDFSFSVRVTGTTSGKINTDIGRLDTFIRSGSEAEPVYFCWRAENIISYEPLWGQQGATKRCRVVNGNVNYSMRWYLEGNARQEALFVDVTLLINPPEGAEQIAAQAKGFVYEDIIGAVAGTSRGVRVMDAATNKITNPVFEHGTWNNDWTAAANIIEEKNTDKQFVLWGSSSAKLHAYGAAGNGYTMLINVGNTNQHVLQAWVKKEDSSAVTATDVVLYYGDQQATTYYSLGDGWYMLWCLVTGVAAGTATGIYVKSKYSVYLAGVQLLEKSYPRPMIYGDELGCSWAGTAHDSTSASAAAHFRLPMANTINHGGGTIRFVWRAPCASTAYGTNNRFFETDTSLFRFLWDNDNEYYIFNDGTNSINSAATTFAANDEIVFHLTWGPTGLVVYRNGTAIAAGATYTAPTTGTYLYIGSAADVTLHSNGMYFDFQTWARPMSGTEVAADYANVAPLVGADLNISRMPYFWTKDGDSVLDNCDDSTRDNWGVVGGVPGSLPARAKLQFSVSSPNTSLLSLVCGVIPFHQFLVPSRPQYYFDLSETGDATSSGGEYETDINGKNTVITNAFFIQPNKYNYFIRAKAGSSTTVAVTPKYFYTAAQLLAGDSKTITTQTTMRIYYLGSIRLQYPSTIPDTINYFGFGFATGTNLDVDYYAAYPGEILQIAKNGNYDYFNIEGLAGFNYDTASLLGLIPAMVGDEIEFAPGNYNMLWSVLGADGEATAIGDTTTFSAIYVTPRWALA